MESKKIYFGDDEDYIKSLESQIKDLNEELEKNTCSSCKDNLELKKRLDVEIETSKWELRIQKQNLEQNLDHETKTKKNLYVLEREKLQKWLGFKTGQCLSCHGWLPSDRFIYCESCIRK